MTISVRAVYEHGVLRPEQPLCLKEGEIVDVTVACPEPDEVARRLRSAQSIADWVEATKLLPPDDGGYDVLRALNENRIHSGEQPLIPGGGDTS